MAKPRSYINIGQEIGMNENDEITLDIATPKGPFTGTFPKTASIQDVITLVSFGLVGTVKLELVATGSGV